MSELDRLLEAAREAEPDPLCDAATEAWVQRARERALATRVDRMIDAARRAEPEALTESELRSMAERAAMTGRARHRRWTRQRVMLASALAATVAAASVTLFVSERGSDEPLSSPTTTAPSEPAPRAEASEPTDLDLPTGDRLVAASGARFEVELPEPRVRRVRLGGGSMLFDVRPMEEGRFSVSTPNARVEVLGTVFSVQATDHATTVWVYEGVVRVHGSGGAELVEAGGVLHLGAGEAGSDALAEAGREAAARRTAEPAGPIASSTIATRPADPIDRAVRHVPEPSAPPSLREPSPRAMEADAPPEEPEETVGEPASATPADVRALIASGDAARALETAEAAIERGETDPWRMLQGDALRMLGRFDDAATAYQRAATELPAPRRQQAGFLEARVRMTELNDAAGALRALRSAEVTGTGSALRERAMVLEVQLLARLGRRAEGASLARDYLRDYPDGPDAEAMRAHAASASEE